MALVMISSAAREISHLIMITSSFRQSESSKSLLKTRRLKEHAALASFVRDKARVGVLRMYDGTGFPSGWGKLILKLALTSSASV